MTALYHSLSSQLLDLITVAVEATFLILHLVGTQS